MSAISKQLFYEKTQHDFDCSSMHPWTTNCTTAFISEYFILNVIKGSGKFFLPVYLVKLLLTYKTSDKKTLLLNFALSELRSVTYGAAMGTSIILSICVLRKLFGRIHYHTLAFIPGYISGMSILVESKENQILDSLIFFNSFVETLLNKMAIKRIWETMMFVGVSGILMHLLTNRKNKIDFNYFWFYTPPMIDDNEENNNCSTCSHAKICSIHVYEGFTKYFCLGYAVHVIKRLIPKMGNLVRKPSKNMGIFFSKSNLYLGLFIGSYVGLYRVLTCYLTRTTRIRKKFHGFIAGIISGFTYVISPNIQILVIAITTLLQLIYDNISRRFNITNHFWQRYLLFSFCQGYLLQERFYNPKTCSSYYINMIDACTNNVTHEIYDQLFKVFLT